MASLIYAILFCGFPPALGEKAEECEIPHAQVGFQSINYYTMHVTYTLISTPGDE